MTSISISSIRQHFSDIVSKVMFAGERVRVERNGKPACAIVSIDDLELLEALEEKADVEAAKKALMRNDFVGLDVFEKELEL
jgi:antitoxin Phd